jgi:hypothetical protein
VLRRMTRMRDAAQNRGPSRLAYLAVTLMALLALVVASCSPSSSSATGSATASSEVAELKGGVPDLQERFNRDSGKIRLILLASPT